MRYQDKHGNEITEGMYLRFEDGSVEQVYAWQTGDESDLGINASNEAYLQAHGLGEFPQELYPLSEFDLSEVEICEPEMEPWQLGMMGWSAYSGNVSLYLAVCAALTGGVGLGYHWQE